MLLRYVLIFGAVRSMPYIASGLAKALTRQLTSFLPYEARLASLSGGFGDRTLTVQETRVSPRSTA